jgi:Ca2+-binding RTX toxin-like protein
MYNVTGTTGSDILDQAASDGPGTIVGLAGDDSIYCGAGLVTASGGEGNDTVVVRVGNYGTVTGGADNDRRS